MDLFLYVQVKASTRMGYGSESTPLSVSTAEEIPIPQMIIFTESLLWLIDLDKQILSNQSVGMLYDFYDFGLSIQ